MKIKIIFAFTLVLVITSSCNSQVYNCRLTIIDSNHVKKTFNNVTLEHLISDVLVYSDSKKIQSVDLKDVVGVKYYSDVKPIKGFLIGGAIGLALYSTVSILFAGHGEYKIHQDFKDVVIGVSMSTFIGGIIGGLLQKSQPKPMTADLSGLTLSEAREEMNTIFEKGD